MPGLNCCRKKCVQQDDEQDRAETQPVITDGIAAHGNDSAGIINKLGSFMQTGTAGSEGSRNRMGSLYLHRQMTRGITRNIDGIIHCRSEHTNQRRISRMLFLGTKQESVEGII